VLAPSLDREEGLAQDVSVDASENLNVLFKLEMQGFGDLATYSYIFWCVVCADQLCTSPDME
jgi:hypothetical protein